MMLATPMMTALPNDVCLMANTASLRHVVEQYHFERSEKHHIAAGDASPIKIDQCQIKLQTQTKSAFERRRIFICIILHSSFIIYLKRILNKS